MKPAEYQNEQTQIDEGPCDIALPSEIKKMPADVFSKYALWKKECEAEEAQKSKRNRKAGFDLKFHEDEIKEDGRPRGAAHIENERFWDLPDDQLHYIIKDASAAVQENPTAGKATQGPGNWSDQINDAATVLTYRKNKRLKADEDTNEGFDTEKHEGVVNDVWFTGDDGEESGGELTYTAYLDPDTGRYRVDPNSLDGNIDVTNNPGRIPEDSVRDSIDGELEEYVAMAQEDADEHAGERDNKYAHGESVEDDNVSGALDTMRNHLNDYNHDPSNRWEKYNQYRNERRQIGQRAKDVTEWGNSHLDQQIAKQKAEDDEKEDVWKKNFDKQSKARLRQKKRRDDQQADQA